MSATREAVFRRHSGGSLTKNQLLKMLKDNGLQAKDPRVQSSLEDLPELIDLKKFNEVLDGNNLMHR